jgi:hypothetical protein
MRMCRWMFSISTMASSTRMPVASVIARNEIEVEREAQKVHTPEVGIADSGSATAVISVARQFRRNSSTTSTARIAPSISVWIAAS